MFRNNSNICLCLIFISLPAAANDSRELKLWQNIQQFAEKFANHKNDSSLSDLSPLSDNLWRSYSESVVTPCTRTAGTLVQYFITRRDGGTAADLKFHYNRFVKARTKCLKILKLDPKKDPLPELSRVP